MLPDREANDMALVPRVTVGFPLSDSDASKVNVTVSPILPTAEELALFEVAFRLLKVGAVVSTRKDDAIALLERVAVVVDLGGEQERGIDLGLVPVRLGRVSRRRRGRGTGVELAEQVGA